MVLLHLSAIPHCVMVWDLDVRKSFTEMKEETQSRCKKNQTQKPKKNKRGWGSKRLDTEACFSFASQLACLVNCCLLCEFLFKSVGPEPAHSKVCAKDL